MSRNMNYTIETPEMDTSPLVINIHIDQMSFNPNLAVDVGPINPTTEDNNPSTNPVPLNNKKRPFDDLANPIYKLPFEYGWTREIRHRTLSSENKVFCDIYYHHSSTQIRYRSLKEIQDFLELSTTADTPLTPENFTFKKRPIGINDISKEFFSNASKSPLLHGINSPDHMVLRARRNSSKIRIVETTDEQNQPSTSTYKQNDLEATPSGSNHLHDVQSTSTSNTVDVVPLENNEIRNVMEIPRLIQTSIDAMIALQPYIKYMKIDQVLTVSRVCNIKNEVKKDPTVWHNVCFKDCTISNWKECINLLNFIGTININTKNMVIPKNIVELDIFWKQFALEIRKLYRLKSIEIHECPTYVINEIIKTLPQLEVLHATSVKDKPLLKPDEIMDNLKLNFSFLNELTNLTEIKIKGKYEINLLMLPSFSDLVNLKIFALTSVKEFPRNIGCSLDTLPTGLEQLEIGDCITLPNNLGDLIKRFVNLKSLRLENCKENCQVLNKLKSHEVFTSIRDHSNLKILELVNINFCDCVNILEECVGLKAILIILAHNNDIRSINSVMKCLKNLSRTLTHYIYGVATLQSVNNTAQQNENNENDSDVDRYTLKTSIPINRINGSMHESMAGTPRLNNTFEELHGNVKFKVIKVPSEIATSYYLTNHFNDIM